MCLQEIESSSKWKAGCWELSTALSHQNEPLIGVCVCVCSLANISVYVFTLVCRWGRKIVRPFSPSCVISPFNSTLIHTSCFALTLFSPEGVGGGGEEVSLAYHLHVCFHFNLSLVSLFQLVFSVLLCFGEEVYPHICLEPPPHSLSHPYLPPSCPQHAPATPLNSSAQPNTVLGHEYRVPEEDWALLIHPA